MPNKKLDTINIILLREKTNTRFAQNWGFFTIFYASDDDIMKNGSILMKIGCHKTKATLGGGALWKFV